MITKFNTVYPGHVDRGPRPVRHAGERSALPNEHLASVFAKAEAIAKLMDGTGWKPCGWPSTTSNPKATR